MRAWSACGLPRPPLSEYSCDSEKCDIDSSQENFQLFPELEETSLHYYMRARGGNNSEYSGFNFLL